MNYDIKIDEYGTKCYYVNNVLHRDDGPAIEYVSGTKEWYINGKPHREDGPAEEYYNGAKQWYKNGLRHREDGPAYEGSNGYLEWHFNDICYDYNNDFTVESWKFFIKTLIFS